MNKSKLIFDRKLVRTRRARGRKYSADPFLFQRCADDACERILDIKRNFTNTLLIGSSEITREIASKISDKLGNVIHCDHNNTVHGNHIICAETALPFAPQSFDLVINLLSLHAVNNVPKALSEFKRILKPDGLFLASLFGGQTLRNLRTAFYETEETLYGHISPRISPMITSEQATNLLQSSGFAMPVIDRDMVNVNYGSLSSLFMDIRRMGDSNALMDRSTIPVSKKFFHGLEKIYKRDFTNTENRKLKAGFEIIWLTGWAPHESQPKPLKPGSATTRLADALGVKEQKL